MNGDNGTPEAEPKTEATTPEETVKQLEELGKDAAKAAGKMNWAEIEAAHRKRESERHELYRLDVESNISHRGTIEEANTKNEALYRVELVNLHAHRATIEINDKHKVELLAREVNAFEQIAETLKKMHGMMSHKQRFQQKKKAKKN